MSEAIFRVSTSSIELVVFKQGDVKREHSELIPPEFPSQNTCKNLLSYS